jgi:hypothetical protein
LRLIKLKTNEILDECLVLFNIHKNVEACIRQKMLSIINSNVQIGRLKNEDAIIFYLFVHAVKELRIPINKRILNEKIKNYIAEKQLLNLQNLRV